jgi:hypothetical protein
MVVVAAAAAAAVGLTRELTGRPGVGSCAQSRTIMSFVNQGQSWRRLLRGNQGQS